MGLFEKYVDPHTSLEVLLLGIKTRPKGEAHCLYTQLKSLCLFRFMVSQCSMLDIRNHMFSPTINVDPIIANMLVILLLTMDPM